MIGCPRASIITSLTTHLALVVPAQFFCKRLTPKGVRTFLGFRLS